MTGDISKEDDVAALVKKVEATLGPISILVNCAGGDIAAKGGKPNPNDALNISLEDAHAVMNRNFFGTMLMCRAVVPGMAARQKGTVINFGSLNGHIGVSPEVVYGCAKAAILHYTRCLALEMRPTGVRVNAVSPGPTTTARFLATRTTDPSHDGRRVAGALCQAAGNRQRGGVPGQRRGRLRQWPGAAGGRRHDAVRRLNHFSTGHFQEWLMTRNMTARRPRR